MDYVALCLIVFFINDCYGVCTKDNPHVIFTPFSSSTIEQAAYYTVVMNKTLDIHFQNMSVTRGWPFDYYDHPKYLDEGVIPLLKLPNTIQLHKVDSDMSTLWKFNVTDDTHEPGQSEGIKYQVFYLNLHVKGAKSVEMTVNDQKITFIMADLSDPYDGYSVYLYEDGEHVQVDCRNPQSKGAVYLEYLTKDMTSASKSAIFDIQLHSESDYSYIDCVYVSVEPADKYVYRTIFVTKKPSFHSNEGTRISPTDEQSANTDGKYSPLLLSSSIGAVAVLLAVIVAAFCFIRTRNTKLIVTSEGDLSNKSDISTSQHAKETPYNLCHYGDHQSNRDMYYNTPEGVENIDPKYHQYTEIDYLRCNPKIGETQNRNSRVYDEPYVQITMSANIKTGLNIYRNK